MAKKGKGKGQKLMRRAFCRAKLWSARACVFPRTEVDAKNFVEQALKSQLRAHGGDEIDFTVDEDERLELWRHQRQVWQLFAQAQQFASHKLQKKMFGTELAGSPESAAIQC